MCTLYVASFQGLPGGARSKGHRYTHTYMHHNLARQLIRNAPCRQLISCGSYLARGHVVWYTYFVVFLPYTLGVPTTVLLLPNVTCASFLYAPHV